MTDRPLLVSTSPDRRAIDCVDVVGPEQFMAMDRPVPLVLVEPSFYDFKGAGNNELGFPFLASSHAQKMAQRLVVFLTYTLENARQYKGYVLDLQEQLKSVYSWTDARTVPFVSCGVPQSSSVLAVMAGHEPWGPKVQTKAVMPSQFFDGMLAHVMRNRPNYPINVSSRFIGAVRSDLNLLPPLNSWAGRSLMVEYKRGKTTEITRMSNEHVGQLFGVKACQYTDDLMLLLPGGVIRAFAEA